MIQRLGEERIDPNVVENHRRIREHLGVDEGFRVETLTPTQFLQLQVEAAQRRVEDCMRKLAIAQSECARAMDDLREAEGLRNRAANEGDE